MCRAHGLTKLFLDGQIVSPAGQKMERYFNRMWANFMNTGNPNNESLSKEKSEDMYLGPPWVQLILEFCDFYQVDLLQKFSR